MYHCAHIIQWIHCAHTRTEVGRDHIRGPLHITTRNTTHYTHKRAHMPLAQRHDWHTARHTTQETNRHTRTHPQDTHDRSSRCLARGGIDDKGSTPLLKRGVEKADQLGGFKRERRQSPGQAAAGQDEVRERRELLGHRVNPIAIDESSVILTAPPVYIVSILAIDESSVILTAPPVYIVSILVKMTRVLSF